MTHNFTKSRICTWVGVIPADGVLQPAHLLGGLDVGSHVLVALGLSIDPGLGPLHWQREAVHHDHHVGVHLGINICDKFQKK